MKKQSIKLFGFLLLSVILLNCQSDPPSVRVQNQRSTKANVQFKQSNGNTINHNDVEAGKFSSYQDVNEGTITATAEIQNEAVSPTTQFKAEEDKNYTVIVLPTTPPTLGVDSEDK